MVWWEHHANLARLYRWLEDRCEAPDPVEYLEKPWKWAPEFEQMLRDYWSQPIEGR